jgi:hypothetical protein
LKPITYYASFSYQAQSWKKPRLVVAKVEWHPDELYPRVGFIVTNLARPAERVVAFYNQRGTAEQKARMGLGASSRSARRPAAGPTAKRTVVPTASTSAIASGRKLRLSSRLGG